MNMGNIKEKLKKLVFGKRKGDTLSWQKFKKVLIESKKILNSNEIVVCFNENPSNVLTRIEGHSLSKGFLPVNYIMLSLPQKLALVIWMKQKLDKENEYSFRFENKPFVLKQVGLNLPIRLDKEKQNEIIVNVNHLNQCLGFEALTSLLFSIEEQKLENVNYDKDYNILSERLYKQFPEVSFDNENAPNMFGALQQDFTQWITRAVVNNQLPYKKYVECREKSLEILDNCYGYCEYEKESHLDIKKRVETLSVLERMYSKLININYDGCLPDVLQSLDDWDINLKI